MTTIHSELWGEGRLQKTKCGRISQYTFCPTSGPLLIEVTARGLVSLDDLTMSIAELEELVAEAKRVEAVLLTGRPQ